MDSALPTAYADRLLPAWWVWPVAVLLPQPVAVAYGSAYGPLVGLTIGGLAAALVIGALIATAPTVAADGDALRAGRAVLPLWAIGEVTVLDGDGLRAARRDPTAFLAVRTWSAPGGVRVQIADPADPHTAWVVTARRPEALARVLRG